MSGTESTIEFAPAGTWAADAVHSHISFEVAYAGVNTFHGGFTEFSATLVGGEQPSLEGSTTVASVDVKDEQLGGHLQAPDFFDAEQFPDIRFRSSELRRLPDNRVVVRGDLTLKGVTQPVELSGTIAPEPSVDPFGRERLGLTLETTTDRTQYGINWNAPNQGGGDYLGNEVKLRAELALVKQEG
jgi:polyisoprenoid-binding protein YceI